MSLPSKNLTGALMASGILNYQLVPDMLGILRWWRAGRNGVGRKEETGVRERSVHLKDEFGAAKVGLCFCQKLSGLMMRGHMDLSGKGFLQLP